MTPPRFLLDGGDGSALSVAPGDELELGGDEGRHAVTVRRIRPGERIEIGDGRGRVAAVTVLTAARARLVARVDALSEEPPPALRLVVVQALAKGPRGELAAELLTELGADAIVPWAAERSVARWDTTTEGRGGRGPARWRSAAREAAKQSRRAWVPDVGPPVRTPDVAALLRAAALPLVLHEAARQPLAAQPVPASGDVVVVVGPEGGLSAGELAALCAAGARVVRLGAPVLRTSTAGAAALAVLSAAAGRWS